MQSVTANMCYANATGKERGGEDEKGNVEAGRALLRQRSRVEASASHRNAPGSKDRASALCVKRGPSDLLGVANSDAASKQLFDERPLAFSVPLFLLFAYGTKEFSLSFPYAMAPWAAARTYIPASYQYDRENTHFDNSAWTWGTDYFLATLMTVLAIRCLTARGGDTVADAKSRDLRVRSALLLLMYAASTLAGAYAHQFYTSVEMMNTTSFRAIWTVCVGTVCAAGGIMGSIGSELSRRFHSFASKDEVVLRLPAVPEWFWVCWSAYMSAVCAAGSISFKRPACDIFIAGTTQFVPTVYCVLLVLGRRWANDGSDDAAAIGAAALRVRRAYRGMYCVGFIANSVLLPAYPLLVQYTGWSLGTINTMLHAWLTMSWGMQALGLRHLCLALNQGGEATAK